MSTPAQLLTRLDEIATAVAATGRGLAVLGLGSVGLAAQQVRLDAYSDLDFFIIAQPGQKAWFLSDLSWFNAPCPLLFSFLNTADGYKALFADGIFCEMAVFEPEELAGIPFAHGRVVWQDPSAPPDLATPVIRLPAPPNEQSTAWHVGEALTNLYVGLGRYHRGEKLTAVRFVQQYAVDRLIALAPQCEPSQTSLPDPFSPERRLEQRFPQLASHLPHFLPGYEQTPQAALAILDYLESHFPVNPAIAAAIRQLAAPDFA
jgi:lincosamide nucleotidyltransferase B/F